MDPQWFIDFKERIMLVGLKLHTENVAQEKRDVKLPRMKSDCNNICELNYQGK